MTPPSAPATVVLAHGAWADGSSWTHVIAELQANDVAVVAAPLPLTSLTDDVAAVDRTIERTQGPVILAAHAYAGAVIAASTHERVHGLVYIAALAPDEGETVADVFYRDPSHPQAPELAPDAHGWIWMPTNGFASAFAQNASLEQTALLATTQRPIATACLQEKSPRPAWRDHPSWYLIAEQDRMINPKTQRFMATRMQAHIHAHDVDHTPLITSPKLVTDLINQALAAQ
jgi:pimeloyl-ACP methyl ester carboxylesterase